MTLRSPREKKKLDAEKQHRGFSKYEHSLRHGKWRRTKRRPAQKVERQQERLVLAAASDEELRDSGFDPGDIVRPPITKWSPMPLGEWIVKQRDGRRARAGRRKR